MRSRGFSLIELVIVVVIIGIIAAIAVPRMSRGAEGASDAAIARDLNVLNKAADLYAAEHGGTFPSSDEVVNQLTKHSDFDGNTSDELKDPFLYGPYIAAIPPAPAGPWKGATGVSNNPDKDVAWVYDPDTGTFTFNAAP